MGASALFGTGRTGAEDPDRDRRPIPVQRQKVRDRAADVASGEKIRFTSHILPKWARRSRSLDALLPVLYLRGVSTGDFQEALAALLGDEAPEPVARRDLAAHGRLAGRSTSAGSTAISRPAVTSTSGPTASTCRPGWSPRRSASSSSSGPRRRARRSCVGFHVGIRESAQSWRELLVDLKARGLAVAPELAVGDGALGFWKALDEVFPGTRHQRCWVHKVANVLNKFPKSMAPTVKSDLRDIWQAETRAAAQAAIDTFAEKYGAKYASAVACLTKDPEALLAFFDFPAEHWDHLRTSNPIESVFATVRHRTVRTKGALSQKTAKLMVFTLVRAASKKWRRLKGANQLPLVVEGVKFTDGVADGDAAKTAPPDQAASPKFSHSSGFGQHRLMLRPRESRDLRLTGFELT